MDRQIPHRRLLLALLVLTLLFIWGNSLLPAEVSRVISRHVTEVLGALLGRPLGAEMGHGLVRKLAHGTEYLLLGLELSLLVVEKPRHRPLVVLLGMAAALVDETIQLFVPGRAGQIRDIWIDLGGCCLGVLITALIAAVRRRRGI